MIIRGQINFRKEVDLSKKIIYNNIMIKNKGNKMYSSNVVHPSHYQMEGISEAMDVIRYSLTEEEYIGFLKGNAMKYILRAKYKGKPTEDWLKATYYIDTLEDYLNEKESQENSEDEEDFEDTCPCEEKLCENCEFGECGSCPEEEDDEEIYHFDELIEEVSKLVMEDLVKKFLNTEISAEKLRKN